jgi:outer membrane protein assembly factor BamB
VYVGSADGWVYAFEAVSGRLLWRFRAAPVERKIPLYGRLSSTWPVASGVLLEDGVVYAAAGIASYDGTHVYALDAVTGRIRWQNNTSGRLVDKDLVTGVSVQGHLLLHNSRLYLAAGNFVSPAIYDIKDGACLNKVNDEWEKIPHTRKWQKAPRGRELFLIDDRVVAVGKMLYGPKTYHIFGKGDPEAHDAYRNQSFCQASTPDVLVRAQNGRVGKSGRIVRIASQSASVIKSKGLWENRSFRRVDALTVTRNAVLAVGRLQANQGKQSENFALAALNVDNGKRIWTEPLPAAPASWGMAVDRDGRIIVALEDGRLVCFSSK